jgi:hypothetical protein
VLLVEEGIAEDEDGQVSEIRKFWPVGKGWEPKDGGKSVAHESGKPRNFNSNSGVGQLLESIKSTEGLDEMKKRGSPMEAATWDGLKFHMTNKEFSFTRDGDTQKYNRMLATEFLGTAGKKTAAKKAGGSARRAASATVEESNGAVSGAMLVKLRKAAKEANDFEDFVERAFDIEGVDGDEEIEAVVLDESEDGIWAKAQA